MTGPVISKVEPTTAPATGQIPVTITGYNFDHSIHLIGYAMCFFKFYFLFILFKLAVWLGIVVSVNIGGKDCPITTRLPNQITCALPAGISSYVVIYYVIYVNSIYC